jgi:2-oxoglutarate ferredoxin oxidoreductase subunit alpha
MSDLDIGMNDWMVPEFEFDENRVPDRGKVLTAEELENMETFYRYLDVDGDGIPYRSLPGVHPKGSYFTRGSGHTKYGSYTEDSAEYQDVLDRLLVKWETARATLPDAEIDYSKFNRSILITVAYARSRSVMLFATSSTSTKSCMSWSRTETRNCDLY